jgi:DNA-binding MarR family transcriptional regulator
VQDEFANQTLRALRRILRATEMSGRRLALATGLTPSQLLALQEIERRGEATPSAIAVTLQFSQATITSLVDRLAARGLVTRQRSERDKRQILLRTTPAGDALLAGAPDMPQEQFREHFAALAPWERAMILAALERLSGLLGVEDYDAAPLLDAGAIDRAGPA